MIDTVKKKTGPRYRQKTSPLGKNGDPFCHESQSNASIILQISPITGYRVSIYFPYITWYNISTSVKKKYCMLYCTNTLQDATSSTYNTGVGLPRLIGKDVSALACKNESQETKHVDGLGLRSCIRRASDGWFSIGSACCNCWTHISGCSSDAKSSRFARFRGAMCIKPTSFPSPSFCQSSETGSRFNGGPTSFFHTNVVPPSPTEPPPFSTVGSVSS